ncbi:MAG: hypothetical protein ACMG6E_00135, partial [Candidatus Roizmanbacteria bacterium]
MKNFPKPKNIPRILAFVHFLFAVGGAVLLGMTLPPDIRVVLSGFKELFIFTPGSDLSPVIFGALFSLSWLISPLLNGLLTILFFRLKKEKIPKAYL